ncbi:CDP-alcohol phosphatidyltransferase family protein [Paraburkholderia heleia]|uniref:CDP-alcohol phosphatidyltransferase family protein n=1 Tax=Paraburkholderia heleia TaxID=634127 RepID=UPI002AB7187C|nr:CDP-alcohol phosphatidyltransferase family protein [Paraburkholderia heleia]
MTENRRPIKSRSNAAIRAAAEILARSSVTPNQISVTSMAFAAIGAIALQFEENRWAMLAALACIQLRLCCNILDGLVAVEGGKRSEFGALYNEFPDRAADSMLFIAAGYATSAPSLGWAAALLAALTAYVRVFGGSLGLEQRFLGPMAKQHRMALLSLACVFAAVETAAHMPHYSLLAALLIIAAGSAVTCITRTLAIASDLEGRIE